MSLRLIVENRSPAYDVYCSFRPSEPTTAGIARRGAEAARLLKTRACEKYAVSKIKGFYWLVARGSRGAPRQRRWRGEGRPAAMRA